MELGAPADHWLEFIRPVWYDFLKQGRRSRALRLQDIRKTLADERPLATEQIRSLAGQARRVQPIAERVVAEIIGVQQPTRG